MSNSFNFKAIPLTKESVQPGRQLIMYYNYVCSSCLLVGSFSLITSLCSFLLSSVICGPFKIFFTMLWFRTEIGNATKILEENNSGKRSTIVKDFMCRQSRSRRSRHYLSYFSSAKPESFSGFFLPTKIQLCLYADN